MKTKVKKPYRLSFKPCRAFFVYSGFILFSFIFTQALRNTVSAVLFVFSLLLPFAELIYILISYFALKFTFEASRTELVRDEKLDITISYRNRLPIPYYFLDAEMCLPDEKGMAAIGYRTRLSSFPFRTHSVRFRRTMRHRGVYTFGLSSVFVYGIFGFFRIRIRVNEYERISVFPKILYPSLPKDTELGAELPSDISSYGKDGGDMTGVRKYASSDPMKKVHWKLSAKSDELLVKLYSSEKNAKTVIFPDMRRMTPDGPYDGRQCDGGQYNSGQCDGERCLEYALGMAKELCFARKNVVLALPVDKGIEKVTMNDPESFGIGYTLSPRTVSLPYDSKLLTSLARGEDETHIYFTSRIDTAAVDEFIDGASVGDTVCFLPCRGDIEIPDAVTEAFLRCGISLYVISETEVKNRKNEK